MSLNDLEQTIFSYFVGGAANDMNIATRWYPRGELLLSVDDKFQMATRKFGMKVRMATKPAADAFLTYMCEHGGWETKPNEYGGTMHQFNLNGFKAALKQLQADDALLKEAAAGGDTFWADKFAALIG